MNRPGVFARAAVIAAVTGLVALLGRAADFPAPPNSGKPVGDPQPAIEAARGFQVPPRFKVGVFASEPEVRNPIALSWDTRGRLWVAENYTYAEREKKFDLSLRDRVVVFTDADGDGKPESRTVFLDTVQRLTSVAVGRGGVWLMCPPQLLFVPDRDGDLKPDGPPEVVLEGFDVPKDNYHNFANGLKFGPDGWLYGRCGASAPGNVRAPDAGPRSAIPLAGGVWRYHPVRKVFEPLTHGTTNPWGHDWDARGECFFVNTVNGHLWHLIPGAHCRRPHTVSPNPLVYQPLEMHADHWHFDTGKGWVASRDQSNSSDLGGGHAHSGAMIYLGDQWPESYRGELLTLNFHGRRANVERLERAGSGFVAKHAPDMLQASDPFFRGIDLTYGPDGSVYILDWSDFGECHENDGVHRASGRIYRVAYGDPQPTTTRDLTKLGIDQLTDLQANGKEWLARMARQELADRQATGGDVTAARPRLIEIMGHGEMERLRALWTLFTLDMAKGGLLTQLLDDPNESVRAWAIRLLTDAWPLDTVTGVSRAEGVAVPPERLERFVKMAREDQSGLVRLTLASTLGRMPIKLRFALAAALASRAGDAGDHNIPPLVWYGLIPTVQADPMAVVSIAAEGQLPQVRQWAARRFAEVFATDPAPLNALLTRTRDKDDSARRDVIAGMTVGFAGVRKATPPLAWKDYPKAFTDEAVRSQARNLEVLFGDGRALDEVRRLALDGKADLSVRKAALRSLIAAKPADLREVCEKLLKVRYLNAVAVQGLSTFADPKVGKRIGEEHWAFAPDDRPAMVEALASRPAFAAALLHEMSVGTIKRGELTAAQARQIRGFNDPALTKRLAEVWGEVRESPADKAALIARLRADLTPTRLKAADPSRGRAAFAATCASCHKLYGTGGDIGPDLTGAGRKDLEYLLSNVVDPSAVVTKDFQLSIFQLLDGRVVSGVVAGENPQSLTVQTAREKVVIPRADIEKRTQSTSSLMPDGLLQTLTPQQVRDLGGVPDERPASGVADGEVNVTRAGGRLHQSDGRPTRSRPATSNGQSAGNASAGSCVWATASSTASA